MRVKGRDNDFQSSQDLKMNVLPYLFTALLRLSRMACFDITRDTYQPQLTNEFAGHHTAIKSYHAQKPTDRVSSITVTHCAANSCVHKRHTSKHTLTKDHGAHASAN